MREFDAWLTERNLQAICTRVGTEDCTIVIEDGVAVQEGVEPAPEIPSPNDPIPESPEKTDEPKEEMEW